MGQDAASIARQFSRLAIPARKAFLQRLRESRLSFSELPIVPATRSGPMPLSPAQHGLWLTWRIEPESPAYNLPALLRFRGDVKRTALESSLNHLVARHEILRTVVQLQENGDAVQVIRPAVPMTLIPTDWRHATSEALEGDIQQWAGGLARMPFRLDAEPPIRAALLETRDELLLVLVIHHIAADGQSVRILIDELAALYEARVSGREPSIQPLPIQFADYALWQRNWLEAGEAERQLAYWREQLGDEHPPIELPFDRPRSARQASTVGQCALVFDGPLRQGLAEIQRTHRVSLFMVMVALFKVALYRFTGSDCIRVGVPLATRDRAETLGLVGHLLNLQVLQTRVDPARGFDALLNHVREAVVGAQENRELPFDALVKALQVEREPGVHPLFQVKCTELPDGPTSRELAGSTMRIEALSPAQAHFDLSLDFVDHGDGVQATLTFKASLFDMATMEHFAAALVSLAKQAMADLNAPIALLRTPEPLAHVVASVRSWADSDVLSLWARSAARVPDAAAVACEERTLTYAQLDDASTRLACALRARGVGAESRVAIHAGRTFEFVVSILAVLKAGGAYVALDPELPVQRLAFLLTDSEAKVLLSADAVSWAGPVPVLDPRNCAGFAEASELVKPHPEQSAYVMYTSGSTGAPKGVVVSHASLSNYIQGLLHRLSLPESVKRFGMVSTVSADLGHTVLFGSLCSGGTLHLIPRERAFDPDGFAQYMQQHRVQVLKIVPSHLQGLLSARQPENALPEHTLILGGEASAWNLMDQIERAGKCRVLNHYGPTETTVGVLMQDVREAPRSAGTVAVGHPLPNVRCHVLDRDLNTVPKGVVGELYVGGVPLSRGYQGRGGLSAERFVASPFGDGERLYRTGDRVRVLSTGAIEYRGRGDDQVKVRGYRVELHEVAQALRGCVGVSDAHVMLRASPDSRAQLQGYVVARQGDVVDVTTLRAALADRLPEYMVPSAIAVLDRMPLTSNGKVDRRALGQIQMQAENVEHYEAPRGPIEEVLAQIWSQLLGVDRIGRHDSFFELGGDSILALRVIARARQQQIELAPRQLFEQQTVSALAEALSRSGTKGESSPVPLITPVPRGTRLPLSSAQSRQWFLWKLDERSTAYHISGALRLQGELNVPALTHAFEQLVTRHESLRTVFRPSADDVVEPVVQPASTFAVSVIDLSTDVGVSREERVAVEASALAHAPFDLSEGPLLRVGLIKQTEHEHVLVLVMHHIVADGWSVQIIVDELVELYRSEVEGGQPALKALPIQYVDYAVWQRNWLAAGERERQLQYWKETLGEEHPPFHLSVDHARTAEGRYQAAHHAFEIPAAVSERLHRCAREHHATLFMVLLAGFQALLHRYTEQNEIRIGVTNANRNLPETQGIVGFFVNTQVLRSCIDGRMRLGELLEQVREAVVGAQQHQDLPFEQLVEALQPHRSRNQTPLFQVMMDHQRRDHGELQNLPGVKLQRYELGAQAAHFELTLRTSESRGGRVTVSFEYAAELFEPQTIERLGRHYERLLIELASNPGQRVADVNLLSEAEQRQLTHWAASRQRHADALPVHHRIEEQVRKDGSAVALTCGAQQLTYAELNLRANQLAHRLMKLGVRAEARVGLALDRSIEMVVAVLAVLKAGGVYVPIDPAYPPDRVRYMVQDSGARWLVTHEALAPTLSDVGGAQRLLVDQLDLNEEPMSDPRVPLHSEQLAYVIYTSGSTGKPKGVQISHLNVARLLAATQEWFDFNRDDVWTLFHSYAFDFSVWEIFGALCYGGRLVVVPHDISRSPEEFLGLLCAQRVTILNQTPSAFRQLMQVQAPHSRPDLALRAVIFGGEALQPSTLKPWTDRFGDAQPRLINMYGITETTVHVTYRPIRLADLHSPQSVIGAQIPDLQLTILDSSLNAVPVGVPGELYVAGDGLARGYLNRPGLTATRFVADPTSVSGARMYRTGDLARRKAHGEIEYLGRADQQVKIRGFRIELGEIEAQLLAQEHVRAAAVVTRDGPAGARIVAYVVPRDGVVDIAQLRESLAAALPEHMVPSAFVAVDRLQLNASGKLDRKSLPEPEFVGTERYEPPDGSLEKALAEIWSETLGVASIGRYDNFFELGGHSLLATRLISRVRRALHVDAPLRVVFECPVLAPMAACLAGLGAHVTGTGTTHENALQPIDRAGNLPLAPVQRRLWTVNELARGTATSVATAYTINAALRLSGVLDATALRRAIETIVARHEVLRTTYSQNDDGEPFAVVGPARPVDLPVSDISALPPEQQSAQIAGQLSHSARMLDLASGPLLATALMKLGDRQHALVLSVHHIAFDGMSQSLFVRELVDLYAGFRHHRVVKLPALPAQYVDYAAWQARRLVEKSDAVAGYWKEYLRGAPALSTVPNDYPRPKRRSTAGDAVRVTLPSDVHAALLRIAQENDVTLFVLLFATFSLLLHQRLDTDDVVIGTDVECRDHPDLERLIGFFVNLVPLRSQTREAQVLLRDWLENARRNVVATLDQKDMPFDEIIDRAGVSRADGHDPLVQVLLVLQNTPAAALELPDLAVEVLPPTKVHSKFDIAVFVQPGPHEFAVSWVFASGLYRRETIENLAEGWQLLLRQIATSTDPMGQHVSVPVRCASQSCGESR